jgi:hypothetical protein
MENEAAMNWELDPELKVLPSWRAWENERRPREHEHPYDEKRRHEAAIMRRHEADCVDPECCPHLVVHARLLVSSEGEKT